ncbi:MAG: hypothetical protein FWD57_07610 [Polyangiaceae bacterium]|nr:hypothetical protein [Polyangiaceae bacterium]
MVRTTTTAAGPIATVSALRRSPTDSNVESARRVFCDACGEEIKGEPTGRGIFIWARGDELRLEEPPLCETCASIIAMSAGAMWSEDDGV